ncbi:MAG: hypothetical protein E6Q97_14650 [Desulfurellales bacterium]|nr:MAG: hypothetical protein E6Q97_14650 [Desulfurellales bacterium]
MEGQSEALATHTRPEERPEWQREPQRFEHHADKTGRSVYRPVYRVPCRSAPMPEQPQGWITKRFIEQT